MFTIKEKFPWVTQKGRNKAENISFSLANFVLTSNDKFIKISWAPLSFFSSLLETLNLLIFSPFPHDELSLVLFALSKDAHRTRKIYNEKFMKTFTAFIALSAERKRWKVHVKVYLESFQHKTFPQRANSFHEFSLSLHNIFEGTFCCGFCFGNLLKLKYSSPSVSF